jgi:hypothetical protein
MNKKIMEHFGFQVELGLIKEGKCPWCKKAVNMNDFRDKQSKKEFIISGLCQSCQDDFFEGRSKGEEGGVPNETGGVGK